MSEAPFQVFISYSHKDEAFRAALEEHLSQLRRDRAIQDWHDHQIVPGQEWEREIFASLETADIVLLLVSSSFLASDFCYAREMTQAIARHEAGSARVVPVILRPCDWKSAPFGKLHALPSGAKPVTTWDNEDQAFLSVAEGLRRVAQELRNEQALSPAAPETGIFAVPPRNHYFTGREDMLTTLAEQLLAPSKPLPWNRAAIFGLGGIGKTQTAVEFAHRHRDKYRRQFFVCAERESDLIGGFAAIARLVGLPEAARQDQNAAAQAARRWLDANEGWLLIFDNADSDAPLGDFLPAEEKGSVLVTSRAQSFAGIQIKPHRLASPPSEEALAFLLERTHRKDVSQAERAAAAELAAELGNLPLALEQAAAYLVAQQACFVDYLASFRRRGLELLKKAGPEAGSHRAPVATTWSLNFQEVQKASPASADLLRAAAFLAPEAIPDELFLEGGVEISPALAAAVADADPLAVAELAAPLLRYSLVERDPEGRTLSVHRLVQQVIKDELGPAREEVQARVVRALCRAFPRPDFATWPRCERLLAHLLAIGKVAEESRELAGLLNAGANYLKERARFGEAEPLFLRSLAIREKILGVDHLEVAASLSDTAGFYGEQHRWTEAEPLFLRSLAIRQQALGADHPEVAESLSNLASLYGEQGHYSQAEPLFLQSLAIREKALGSDHSAVAKSLNNLAALYLRQGRLNEAEPLGLRALSIWEKTLGADHPYVATSLNNLAIFYRHQGRLTEAEPLQERALHIWEKSLGADHPRVATALDNLATLYRHQGRDSEAEELEEQAREVMARHDARNRTS